MLKVRRSGKPQALQVQIHHLHPDVRHLARPQRMKQLSGAVSAFAHDAHGLSLEFLKERMMSQNGGVNMLPWKTSMMLVSQDPEWHIKSLCPFQDDFHCTAGALG